MKVKATEAGWYEQKLIEEGEVFEYREAKTEDELPQWCEPFNAKFHNRVEQSENEEQTEDDTDDENEEEASEDNLKVGDLPLVEKNSLIEEAKALNVKVFDNYKVSTVKNKIAQAKQGEE